MPNVILIRNEYPDTRSLYHVIDYVLGKAVIRGGYGVDCDITSAKEQMHFVKQAFHKTERLQLKHFIISFAGSEAALVDFDEFLQLGFLTGQLFREYQMVYGVHLDGSHIHMHFVMNTTSFLDGHQYCDGLSMFNRMCDLLRDRYPRYSVHLCTSRHFSKGKPYTKADFYDFSYVD
ncbi:MAG: relaxase/mobilization nuclease domain-containing protein [Clostridiales bacterium]|nr:relaxase/mobilization nuclease domain-containing protein [Clostridiales bacterium]